MVTAIEVKAPGKRKALRASQRDFLERVIAHNGFGIVADSVASVSAQWLMWSSLNWNEEKQLYLNEMLPAAQKESP